MSIATVDDIAAALSVAQRLSLFKTLSAAKAAGSYQSGWLSAGNAGAAPPAYTAGSGYTCDDSTVGAIPYANGSVQNRLARLAGNATTLCTIVLYDRLWSCSGMGFAAGTYAVTTPGDLPARITDDGLGCEAFIENFVAAGAASGTATLNYKDSANASVSAVIAAVTSAPVAGQMQAFPLANGLGVKQITSVVTSATWTSGSFGITVLKRVAEIYVPVANAGAINDWGATGLVPIPSDACLAAFILASATTATNIDLKIDVIDK